MRVLSLLLLICVLSSAQEEDDYYSEEDINSLDLSSVESFLNDVMRDNSSSLNSSFQDDLVHFHTLTGRAIEAMVAAFYPSVSETLQTVLN